MRRIIAVMAAVAAMLLFAAPASAQNPYEGVDQGLGADDVTPVPGQTVTITGDGCPPGGAVEIYLGGTLIGSVTANAEGAFSAVVEAPSAAGSYTINAVCGGGDVVLGIVVTVQEAADTGDVDDDETLPATGSDSLPLVQLGIGLVAMGGLAVLTVRKRQLARVPTEA